MEKNWKDPLTWNQPYTINPLERMIRKLWVPWLQPPRFPSFLWAQSHISLLFLIPIFNYEKELLTIWTQVQFLSFPIAKTWAWREVFHLRTKNFFFPNWKRLTLSENYWTWFSLKSSKWAQLYTWSPDELLPVVCGSIVNLCILFVAS